MKIHCQFRYSPTTLRRLNWPFPGKLASHNSMGKKEDNVGNKTGYKKESQECGAKVLL